MDWRGRHRFYLPPEQAQGDELILSARESHHALNVLRLKAGDTVIVVDGAGRERLCEVVSSTRKEARLTVLESRVVPGRPWEITLIQAVPKGKTMDAIVQKATELGAARIRPLLSKRSVVKLDNELALQKTERWRSVAIEAIKQCAAARLPTIEPPLSVDAALQAESGCELALVASLDPEREPRHPRCHFQAFASENGRRPRSVALWVGPEGDFTAEESRTILSHGALPVSFGDLVLRAETAAVYGLSFLRYELDAPVSP